MSTQPTIPTIPTIPVINTGIEKDLNSNLVSGNNIYHNPLEIYNPGHKKYLDYVYGEKTIPDISGIVTNINTLSSNGDLKILQPDDTIRLFNPELTEDFTLQSEHSGLSVNLKFGNFNVVTTSNTFKNF